MNRNLLVGYIMIVSLNCPACRQAGARGESRFSRFVQFQRRSWMLRNLSWPKSKQKVNWAARLLCPCLRQAGALAFPRHPSIPQDNTPVAIAHPGLEIFCACCRTMPNASAKVTLEKCITFTSCKPVVLFGKLPYCTTSFEAKPASILTPYRVKLKFETLKIKYTIFGSPDTAMIFEMVTSLLARLPVACFWYCGVFNILNSIIYLNWSFWPAADPVTIFCPTV